MRMTIGRKIGLGCILIVGLGCAAMAVAYGGLLQVRREVRYLADVHEPVKSATHEMEINVKGVAFGTMSYLSAPTPLFRDLVADNESDFLRFHAEYERLATTPRERELGAVIGERFKEFRAAGEELKTLRDAQASDFDLALLEIEQMDEIIDGTLQTRLDPAQPADAEKLEALNSIEADLAEVGMSVAAYGWLRRDEVAQQLSRNTEEVLASLDHLQPRRASRWTFRLDSCDAKVRSLPGLTWKAEQRAAVDELESRFGALTLLIEQVLSTEESIRDKTVAFLAMTEELDRMLDEDMQPLAAELVRQPRRAADAAAARVLGRVRLLIPCFVVVAAVTALGLTRRVTRPLRSLARGADEVSRGDLAYRLASTGRDEFADLAGSFNRMVARLQETLVSKKALEASEAQLRDSLATLEEEMRSRARAEADRTRLEESLRKSELLSAMGTLVAGVAHQVRNPLFAVTSVLDAMEARLGPREEYARYLGVLREQTARVAVLMNELMEFGGGASGELTAGDVESVVREAVSSCRGRAEARGVTIDIDVDGALPPVKMDRPRLVRAMENLIDNAVQHSPGGQPVAVAARLVSDDGAGALELCVKDRGPGFQSDELPRLFEPFFTRRPGGTGLGLAIVERIVQHHGGRVVAANGASGGAVMTVRLPVEASTASIPARSADGGSNA